MNPERQEGSDSREKKGTRKMREMFSVFSVGARNGMELDFLVKASTKMEV